MKSKEINNRMLAALSGMNPYDDVFKETEEICKNCGKPKSQHLGRSYWCGKFEEVGE